jgi:5-oxoprolinase (ATP-hydrolysing)
MKSAFEAAHKSRFGFIDRDKALVIEAVSIEAIGGGAKFSEPIFQLAAGPPPAPARGTRFYSGGAWRAASVFLRDQLSPGHRVRGPAIIIEPHQTIVIEEGWEAAITAKNHIVIERVVALKRQSAIGTAADPVMLEVFNNLFMSIAEQMGVSLQNTAYSSTSRSGLTSPAPCLQPTARSSPMPRICRCISGPWTVPWRP